MGKAQKQAANSLRRKSEFIDKEIARLKQDKVFIEMIEAMDPEKPYRVKQENKKLFGGKQFSGAEWKATFLEPKPAENDTPGN